MIDDSEDPITLKRESVILYQLFFGQSFYARNKKSMQKCATFVVALIILQYASAQCDTANSIPGYTLQATNARCSVSSQKTIKKRVAEKSLL